jgi:DnaJ-domain-containing protein 1
MLLPGRLRQTTLGDLLGTLHRARVHGTLELAEDLGRTHRIHVADGLVVAVEFDGAAATLAEVLRDSGEVDDGTLRRSLLRAIASKRLHGEVLVQEFRLSETIVDAAVRQQMTSRLTRLDQLTDAQIHFRVTVRVPRGAVTLAPLPPTQFLSGRRRFRDRGQASSTRPPAPRRTVSPSADAPQSSRRHEPVSSAWRVLGVVPGADTTEIKRAYRRLAREFHPDLHPEATDPERRDLAERFSALTNAYRTLVA